MRKVFEKSSKMSGTAEQMMIFHSAPKAFRTLTPPPVFIQVLRDDRKSITDGEIDFRMWMGFIPLHWLARHETGSIPTSFIDRMLDGPMAYWEHQHIFRDTPDGVELTDHIAYEHKTGLVGIFTRLFFDGLPLKILFLYRHLITKRGMVAINKKG
jgi:ligand-binding SRPBCC domain-containing protein